MGPLAAGGAGRRRSIRQLSLRAGGLLSLLAAALMMVGFMAAARGRPLPSGDYCYLQGDRDHTLTWVALNDFDPRTNETTLGANATMKLDALALQPRTGVLYGVDALMPRLIGYLGTFDTTTGAFQRMDTVLGSGQGALGEIHFYDVSGIAFDPVTGWLYAAQIETGHGVPDALFRIDPETGQFVRGAFGGLDYVPMFPLPDYPLLWDVDDIAIDPATGQMYGILNNSNDGDRLVRIDKATGAVTDVGAFGVGEVEGLSFDPHGQLWATAGGVAGTPANQLYAVDKATGAASSPRLLDNSGNYEGLACLTAAPDLALSLSERGRPATPGEPLVYTLRYTNLGNAAALGVTLTHTLPVHTRFHAPVSSPGWQPAPGAAAGVYTLDLGTVPPGHRGVVNLAAMVLPGVVDAPGPLTATASLAGDASTGVDLNPEDNGARVSVVR
jgi:uncharacterized repeat protein (TIGR01451 family)